MLLTIDKNLSFQQNVKQYDLILVVFDSPSSSIEFLQKYIPAFETQLTNFQKGKIYIL